MSMKIVLILANSANPNKMPPYAAFHLGLHSMPKYLFGIQNEKVNYTCSYVVTTYLGCYLPQLPKFCICDKLFPTNWLSACHDDNQKSCILTGERLSCLARDDVRCKQVAWRNAKFTSILCLTYIFVHQTH